MSQVDLNLRAEKPVLEGVGIVYKIQSMSGNNFKKSAPLCEVVFMEVNYLYENGIFNQPGDQK